MSGKEFVPITAQRNVGLNPQIVPNTSSYSPTFVLFPNLSSSSTPGNIGHDDNFSREFFDISSQSRDDPSYLWSFVTPEEMHPNNEWDAQHSVGNTKNP